jgi:hypothetical protein
MVSLIHLDDLITIDDEFSPFKGVKIGDIIVYRAPDPSEQNKVLVHRVMSNFKCAERTETISYTQIGESLY